MSKLFIIPGIILAIAPQSILLNAVGVLIVVAATAYEFQL